MRSTLIPILFLSLLIQLGGTLPSQGESPADIIEDLASFGYEIDRAALEHAAIASMAQKLDPKAQVLDIPARASLQKTLEGREDADREGPLSFDPPEEWAEGLCYLRLRGIHQDSRDIITQLKEWASDNKTGIMIDARGAAGTHLEGLDQLLDLFIGKGQALYQIQSIDGSPLEKRLAQDKEPTLNTPCILIVDPQTTAASELLAGVLGHYNTLLVLGQATSGDNRLRAFIPIDQKTSLYVGTRKVVLANDHSYETSGVTPDIIVPIKSPKHRRIRLNTEKAGDGIREELKREQEFLDRIGEDHVLEHAADILLALHALKRGGADDSPKD